MRSSRKEEIQSLSGPNELNEFYDRFRQLKEFHRRYPGEVRVIFRWGSIVHALFYLLFVNFSLAKIKLIINSLI